jgi:hypothetical protein
MTEEAVQGRLVGYLVKEGWQILRVAQTAARERGTDLLAARDGRTLAVEVKGYTGLSYSDPRRAGEVKPTQPATQARHWYAQAVLKGISSAMNSPTSRSRSCFPTCPPTAASSNARGSA